jgi:acyl-CoA synthetase (AMP-forming)/AMP-acid ligase II
MPAPDYQLLIKSLLKTAVAQASRKEIVYRGTLRLSYPQFVERVHRLGAALKAMGVGHGTVVAVADWDSHRYLESYFAIPALGATLMMVNIRLSPEQIAYTLDHAGAEVLLLNNDFQPLCAAIRDKLPKLKTVIGLIDDGAFADPDYFAAEYEAMLAAHAPLPEFPDFDENTRATTFYTTGTTGLPKGVYFTHRQLVLHTLSLMATLMMAGINGRISREDVYMPLTPMFHVHAWGFPFAATMLGMKQVYVGRFLPPVVVRLLATEGITVSHCVPTIMHMILTAPEAKDVDLRGWKVIIGGSALPRALCAAGLARGIDLYSGYGMSETCPIVTLAQLKAELVVDVHAGTAKEIDYRIAAGLPAAMVEVEIVDEAMKPLAHDGLAAGEVVVRSPFLTQGYAGNPEASEALWRGGWLHTGDIGTLDAEGYLHIVDRSKDVVKTGGEWVSSIGLEDIILTNKAVSECAVIGVPDTRWGERPIAIVVLRQGQKATEEEIKAVVRARADRGEISRYAVPDRVVFVEALEKTSVGKLDKKKIRVLYADAAA